MLSASFKKTMALATSLGLGLALAVSAGCGDDDGDSADGNPGDGGSGDGGGDGDGDGDAPDGGDGDVDAAVSSCEPVNGTNLGLELVSGGFDEPIFATAPAGDPRLFVVSKHGAISIVKDGEVLETPFLDIDARVASSPGSGEQGLLGLAFHPDFASNGRFFVYYTAEDSRVPSPEPVNTVSEFTVSDSDPDIADAGSERLILEVEDPFSNHNGGMIAFDEDGYLHIGLGDGGSGGDPQGNGQNQDTLLGDMLRIDIDRGDPYGIPADNPYAGGESPRPEIFISGVRNPWRWSFDRDTGDMYIGDVGQGGNDIGWEEVDVLLAGEQAGANLGWDEVEGVECYPPGSGGCQPNDFVAPVTVYMNPPVGSRSITGGYVYRGGCYPGIQGRYFYGDYVTNEVWTFVYADGPPIEPTDVTDDIDPDSVINGLSSFGEDAFGELYVVSLNSGEVFRITAGR